MPRNSAAQPARERRRREVAGALIAGRKPRQIARELGVNHKTVRGDAKHPATRLMMAELMRPHHARLRKLAAEAIEAVDRALKARTIKGRHDYDVQLKGVGRLSDLAHLAQGTDKAAADEGGVTWQQFLVLVEQHNKLEQHIDKREEVVNAGHPALRAAVG